MEIEEIRTKTSFCRLKKLFCQKCDDSRMIKNMNRQGANFSEPIKTSAEQVGVLQTLEYTLQTELLLLVLSYG